MHTAGAVNRIKRVGLSIEKDGIIPIHRHRSRNGIRTDCDGIAEINRARIAEIAAVVVIHAVVRRESPVSNTVRWKPIRSKRFTCALAAGRNDRADDSSGADVVNQSRLNVIFASEAV